MGPVETQCAPTAALDQRPAKVGGRGSPGRCNILKNPRLHLKAASFSEGPVPAVRPAVLSLEFAKLLLSLQSAQDESLCSLETSFAIKITWM